MVSNLIFYFSGKISSRNPQFVVTNVVTNTYTVSAVTSHAQIP